MLTSTSNKKIAQWSIIAAVLCLFVITPLLVMAGGGEGNDKTVNPNTNNSTQDIPAPEPNAVPNEIVVKFAPSVNPGLLLSSGSTVRMLTHSGVFLYTTTSEFDMINMQADFDTMGAVIYFHPNYVVNRLHPVQGSYPFSDEYVVGDYSSQAANSMLGLDASHGTATGTGITVAVLDGGVDASYPELAGVVTSGWDFVSNDDDAFDESGGAMTGHGTFVAGVVHLAAPDAQIKSYRVIDSEGYGDGFTLALAIERAVDDGCDVINISLVLMEEHLAVRDAIDYAESQGVSVVASAGNEANATNLFPASYRNVISVAAIDSTMLLADFASYGTNIDICAPGTMIYSTYKDGLYAWWSGSSFAAPFVAGQVAMLKQVAPASSNSLLGYAVKVTGTDIDLINPDVSGLLGGGMTDPMASINGIDGLAMASITPDTLYIDVYAGRVYFTAPTVSAFLTSTNAPADYTAEVVDNGDLFSTVMESTGSTDAWIEVSVDPSAMWLGTYYDEVLITVSEVSEPVSLTICATMHPPVEYAWLSHPTLSFYANVGDRAILSAPSILYSSNAPANFTAEVLPSGPQFTTLLSPTGVTDDSVTVIVNPALLSSVGTYLDSVMCIVEGVADPVYLQVWLTLTDSAGGGGGSDSAWVTPMFHGFSVPNGVDSVQYGSFTISSAIPASQFTVTHVDLPDFLSVENPTGVTSDSVYFTVTSSASMEPGIYYDTLSIDVEGASNSPIRVMVLLLVQATPGDSLYLSLDTVEFTVTDGSTTPVTVSSYLTSTNSPMNFTGFLDTVSSLWMTLVDTVGTTDDSVSVIVDPTGFSPETYYGTAFFQSPDADNTARLFIKMIVESRTEPAEDSLVLTPDVIDFTVMDGSTTPVVVASWISSVGEPLNYTASYGPASHLWMTIIDTVGTTDDSVRVSVDPTGFSPETYAGLVYYTTDAGKTTPLLIRMTVVPNTGMPTAWTNPTELFLSASEGSTTPVEGTVDLYSSNAPANYVGWSMNASGLNFVSLPDSAGITNSAVTIQADPTGLTAGSYSDTVLFSVTGISDLASVVVNLTITADTMVAIGLGNYPNPFNPSTQITFSLATASQTSLTVYNVMGQQVTTLVDEYLEAGEHLFYFDGSGRASGIYFYRLQTETSVETKKMILLK